MTNDLALRAELAGLNASAPPQQTDIDGWLIRLNPTDPAELDELMTAEAYSQFLIDSGS